MAMNKKIMAKKAMSAKAKTKKKQIIVKLSVS